MQMGALEGCLRGTSISYSSRVLPLRWCFALFTFKTINKITIVNSNSIFRGRFTTLEYLLHVLTVRLVSVAMVQVINLDLDQFFTTNRYHFLSRHWCFSLRLILFSLLITLCSVGPGQSLPRRADFGYHDYQVEGNIWCVRKPGCSRF